jgi:hypothetical protein
MSDNKLREALRGAFACAKVGDPLNVFHLRAVWNVINDALRESPAAPEGGEKCTTGCLINTQVGSDHRHCDCPCPASPSLPAKEERRKLGGDEPMQRGDYAEHTGLGGFITTHLIQESMFGESAGKYGCKFCDVYRPAPAAQSAEGHCSVCGLPRGSLYNHHAFNNEDQQALDVVRTLYHAATAWNHWSVWPNDGDYGKIVRRELDAALAAADALLKREEA